MDVGCWGVISDHLKDYCCQVESLEFQHLDADFLLQSRDVGAEAGSGSGGSGSFSV